MNSVFNFILSESVLIPLLIGVIRFNRIRGTYHPFFWLLVLGFVTETISGILIHRFHTSNAIPVNLDVLGELLLIAWQFRIWNIDQSGKKWMPALVSAMVVFWIIENLVFGHIRDFSPYFRVSYSFLVVLFSVNRINFLLTYENRNLLKNPRFLICIGFIIFYLYQIVYEWAYQVSLEGVTEVTASISFLFDYINVFSNLIFAAALLLIPSRRKFTFS